MTKIIWQEATGSTNDDAKALAQSGEFGPLWIGAAQQTRGRGRRQRKWESPAGNLYASWLTRLDVPLETAAQLSFVAALAVAAMARHFLPPDQGDRLAFKWPNDVLINGRKFCGILIESGSHQGAIWLVAGIGVNLIHAPDDARFPAAALDIDVPPQDALEKLAEVFDSMVKIWDGNFANIKDVWLSSAANRGKIIDVNLPDENLTGRFDGIDDHGALILAQPGGSKRMIEAGDVFFKKNKQEQA